MPCVTFHRINPKPANPEPLKPSAQGGCIIRAEFLDDIRKAYALNPELANLLVDPEFASRLAASDAAWRRVVGLAIANGVPVPGFTASLSYFDTYRRDRLPANLVQVRAKRGAVEQGVSEYGKCIVRAIISL